MCAEQKLLKIIEKKNIACEYIYIYIFVLVQTYDSNRESFVLCMTRMSTGKETSEVSAQRVSRKRRAKRAAKAVARWCAYTCV